MGCQPATCLGGWLPEPLWPSGQWSIVRAGGVLVAQGLLWKSGGRVWAAGVAGGGDHRESASSGERNLIKLAMGLCRITPGSIPPRFLAGRIFECAPRDS